MQHPQLRRDAGEPEPGRGRQHHAAASPSHPPLAGTRSPPSPPDAWISTLQAALATAEVVAPFARYTPAPGYVGTDEFEYVANAKGVTDQQVLLRVRVKVHVMGQ